MNEEPTAIDEERAMSDLTFEIRSIELHQIQTMTKRIDSEQPTLVYVYLFELYRRCEQLAEAGGDKVGAERWRWCAQLFLWYRNDDDRFRIREAALDDVNGPWHAAPADCYETFYRLASDPEAPASVRAGFLHALWELKSNWRAQRGGLPKPGSIGTDAIRAHLETFESRSRSTMEPAARGMFASFHWNTAASIAFEMNRPQLLAASMDRLRAAAQEIVDPAPHWSLKLLKSEVDATVCRGANTQLVSIARLEHIANELASLKSHLRAKEMDHVEVELIDVQVQVEQLLGRRPTQQEVARRRADLLAEHAEAEKSGLLQALRWKQAAGEYRQAGLHDESARAKEQSRKATQSMHAKGELEKHAISIPIDRAQIQLAIDSLFAGATSSLEILERLSQHLFAPSIVNKVTPPRSLASRIFQTIPLVDDRMQQELVPDSDAQAQHERRELVMLDLDFQNELLLAPIVDRLRSEFQLHPDDVLQFLAPSDAVDGEDLHLWFLGILRFLRQDLVSALHILVPRVEQMIRVLLRARNVDTTGFEDGSLKERTLGSLLYSAREKKVFSESVVELLQTLLTDDSGFNIRNKIAHGWMRPLEYSDKVAARILHVGLLIAALGYPAKLDHEPT